MTASQARKRINEMMDEYAYSPTWPVSYQQEYERLCAIIHKKPARRPQAKGH